MLMLASSHQKPMFVSWFTWVVEIRVTPYSPRNHLQIFNSASAEDFPQNDVKVWNEYIRKNVQPLTTFSNYLLLGLNLWVRKKIYQFLWIIWLTVLVRTGLFFIQVFVIFMGILSLAQVFMITILRLEFIK